MNNIPSKYLLLFFALLFSGSAFPQPPDTIVVYEYIYKTDTVWLESKPTRDTFKLQQLKNIEDATLFIDTTTKKANLEIFSSGKSATIPIKHIIYNGKQEQSKMKRRGFFTLLLLPFQMMSFGQAEFSINAGSSSMWLEHGVSTVSNPMWIGAHIGANTNFPLKNKNWSITFGVQGQFVAPSSEYIQKREISTGLSELEIQYVKVKTDVILNELNTGLFTAPFWQIEVPVKVNYKIKNFEPFLGVSYNFSSFIYDIPEEYIKNGFRYKEWLMDTKFHDISLIIGTNYRMSKHWGLSLEVSNGLIGMHNYFQNYIYPTLGAEDYSFNSLNMNFSATYIF
jgi:hypothetical protein